MEMHDDITSNPICKLMLDSKDVSKLTIHRGANQPYKWLGGDDQCSWGGNGCVHHLEHIKHSKDEYVMLEVCVFPTCVDCIQFIY